MSQVTAYQNPSGTYPMSTELDLLTLAEVAHLLKVSTVTLRRWIKQGRLPAYHVGPRKVRIHRSDMTKALAPTYQQEEVSAAQKIIRPLTDEQITQGIQALKEADAVIEAIRSRRKGKPLRSSVPIIHRSREQRSKQLLT